MTQTIQQVLQDRPVGKVLRGAARSILMQQRINDQQRAGEPQADARNDVAD